MKDDSVLGMLLIFIWLKRLGIPRGKINGGIDLSLYTAQGRSDFHMNHGFGKKKKTSQYKIHFYMQVTNNLKSYFHMIYI